MKTRFLLFILIITFFSCKKENTKELLLPDPDYPYTYSELTPEQWHLRLNELNNLASGENVTLDEYGFLKGKFNFENESGTNIDSIKSKCSKIVRKYSGFLGIEDISDINFSNDFRIRYNGGVESVLDEYYQEELNKSNKKVYYPFIDQEKLREIKIENTSIRFIINLETKSIGVSGNWYPEVFIPSREIIPLNSAIKYSKKLYAEEFADRGKPDDNQIAKSHFIKVIFPLKKEGRTELHECWEITFFSKYVSIYVDTQTGEIIDVLDYAGMI
jgi:hypothetical protein